jgi:hypothetical protein
MGADATVVVHMVLGFTYIVRAAKPYRRLLSATGRTISGDFGGCNRGVGARTGIVARELAPVRQRSCRKTEHYGVSEEIA